MLLHMVENHLKETSNMREKAQDFIRKIVNIYTLHLMKQGDIPIVHMEDIMTDLEAEVIEMYRKKTYGFMTLEEYRRHKYAQKNDN